MFAGLTVSQRPVSILIKSDLFQRWKRTVSLSRGAIVQGKYSCTVYGREPNSFFHDSLSTFLPTACQVTISEMHPQTSAGRAHPVNLCTKSTGSGSKPRGRSESPRGQPHLLLICPALMAQGCHLRRTLARRGEPRVGPCLPIQPKSEAAPTVSLYCQGGKYLHHVTDSLVH